MRYCIWVLFCFLSSWALAKTHNTHSTSSQVLSRTFHFDLPNGSLHHALTLFSAQSGLQLFYRHSLVTDKTITAIKGHYSVEEILQHILAGQLTYRISNPQTVSLQNQTPVNATSPQLTSVTPATLSNQPTELEYITIVGDPYKKYMGKAPNSATKLDMPWLQTPHSVSVISLEQFQDTGAFRLAHTMNGISGIKATLGEGARDQFVIRGFDALFDTYRDGLRDDASYQAYRSLANIDQVEVVKGSAGALYGRGSTGGLINLITKKANGDTQQHLSSSLLSNDTFRLTADLGKAMTEQLNSRLNLSFSKGRQFMENSQFQELFIAPTFRYYPHDSIQLDIEAEYLEQDLVPYRGVPSVNGQPIHFNKRINFSAQNDYQHLTSTRGGVSMQTNVLPNLLWKNKLSYSRKKLTQKGTRNSAPNNGFMTQNVVNFGFAPQVTWAAQSELTWQHEHYQLLLGIDVNELNRTTQSAIIANARVVNLNDIHSAKTVDPGFKFNRQNKVLSHGAYAQAIYSNEQLSLLGAIRVDAFNTEQIKPNTHKQHAKHQKLSPKIGAVYQLTSELTAYMTLGRSYQLPWGGGFMPHEKARMMRSDLQETGFKTYLLNGNIMMSGALFHINRETPLVNESGELLEIRNRTHKGLELESKGKLAPTWHLSAGYSYIVAKERLQHIDYIPDDVPKHLFTVWTDYELLPKLNVGGGFHYTGQRFAGDKESVSLGAYPLFDFSMNYMWENKKIQLNINNVFNKHYYIGATNGRSGAHQIGVGAPRNLQLTYSVQL